MTASEPAQATGLGDPVSDDVLRDAARLRASERQLSDERRRLIAALSELEIENAGLVALDERLEAMREDLGAAQAQRDEALAQRDHALAQRDEALARLAGLQPAHDAVIGSLSWRLTVPLRSGIARLRQLTGRHDPELRRRAP